jgi:hypothetical protein
MPQDSVVPGPATVGFPHRQLTLFNQFRTEYRGHFHSYRGLIMKRYFEEQCVFAHIWDQCEEDGIWNRDASDLGGNLRSQNTRPTIC